MNWVPAHETAAANGINAHARIFGTAAAGAVAGAILATGVGPAGAVSRPHSGFVFGLATGGPNGSAFGILCLAANSADNLDVSKSWEHAESGHDDPAMHATDAIDYEIILSGKVDVELPGGKVRTLQPGDILVTGGVPHAWKNRYDEDCLYDAITVGFNTKSQAPHTVGRRCRRGCGLGQTAIPPTNPLVPLAAELTRLRR